MMKIDPSAVFVEEVTTKIGDHILTSTVRKATQKDVDEAMAKKNKGRCPHNIIKDQKTYLYDIRECALCGKGLGLI